MKINFSRSVLYTPKWNGNEKLPESERIFATLKPLTLSEVIELADVIALMSQMRADLNEEEATKNVKDMGKVFKAVKPIVAANCELQGLEDENGPVKSESLMDYGVYMDLATEIMGKLAEISMPSGESEKNSAGASVS